MNYNMKFYIIIPRTFLNHSLLQGSPRTQKDIASTSRVKETLSDNSGRSDEGK